MKRYIWTNLEEDGTQKIFEDLCAEAIVSGEAYNPDDLLERARQVNDDYFQDERINLNVPLPAKVLCIADLGLWNGRFPAYKLLRANLNSFLAFTDGDFACWWVDTKDSQLRGAEAHHDGCNYYLYRGIKPDTSEAALQKLLDAIVDGKDTKALLSRYTYSLGKKVKEVYGW